MGNIQNVKEAYTTTEWKQREQYYLTELGKIVVPEDPDTKEVKKVSAQIDSLVSEANMDFGYIDRNYSYYTLLWKNAEKEIFSILKSQEITSGNTKITENDVKGLTVGFLKKTHIKGLTEPNYVHPQNAPIVSIYDAVIASEKRQKFMKAVLDTLANKRESLVTANGMLKIEHKV